MKEENRQDSPKKCAIYASTVRSRKESIEAQVETCLAEALKHDWVVADHHIFRDKGLKRNLASSERPGLRALLKAARSKPRPFDWVLVDAGYRLSFRSSEIFKLYSTLKKAGINLGVALNTNVAQDNLKTA
jgi:DNA invertase Pin-like site-specific DNA recombinase